MIINRKDLDKLINAYGADRVSEFYMSGLIDLRSSSVDYMLSKKKRPDVGGTGSVSDMKKIRKGKEEKI